MADAGWIWPLYHGNEAETDLMPVGGVDWTLVLRRFTRYEQICTRATPADAIKYRL